MAKKILTLDHVSPFKNRLVTKFLDSISKFNVIQKINYELTQDETKVASLSSLFQAFGCKLKVKPGILELPKDKPIIIISNHPFGLVEFLLIHEAFAKYRSDIKCVVGELLLPIIGDNLSSCIVTYNYSGKKNFQKNMAACKEMSKWLQENHMLWIAPSGSVSKFNLKQRKIVDPKWHRSVAFLQQEAKACVIPVFIEGRTSTLFQMLAFLNRKLGALMMLRENIKQRKNEITMHVGEVIEPEALAKMGNLNEVTAYLREKTYRLSET